MRAVTLVALCQEAARRHPEAPLYSYFLDGETQAVAAPLHSPWLTELFALAYASYLILPLAALFPPLFPPLFPLPF